MCKSLTKDDILIKFFNILTLKQLFQMFNKYLIQNAYKYENMVIFI